MKTQGVPSLVVFDLSVTRNSPAGGCVLSEVSGLRQEYDVTVFSDKCDVGQGVVWVRVPLPVRPIFLRYWIFQILATIKYLAWRMKHSPPDIVQSTQGQFFWPDVCYAHFCHGAYLRSQWKLSGVSGLRRIARWMNHIFNTYAERRAFTRARRIVVPSKGLAREIAAQYPHNAGKIAVIANPVDIPRLSRPPHFDRVRMRETLGLRPNQMTFSFLALGDFARKGLDVVIRAFALLPERDRSRARVLIIGGQTTEIREYQDKVSALGHSKNFHFVGFQNDPRPYLWASDVFLFPSGYETFSLAIHEAAAAGLPMIVTQGLYGVEELVVDGENGWSVPRTGEGVCNAIQSALEAGDHLALMSIKAFKSVEQFHPHEFVASWRNFYRELINS